MNRFFSENGGILNVVFTQYFIYLLPVFLLVLWFKNLKVVALKIVFSVILAWPVIGLIIGKIVNRPRPFESENLQELVFHRPTYSFPSDHAAATFAVFFSLYLSGHKKISWFVLAVAIIISFFRISSGLHFPSDIVAGALVGMGSAYLIEKMTFLQPVYDFIIKIAKKMRLA